MGRMEELSFKSIDSQNNVILIKSNDQANNNTSQNDDENIEEEEDIVMIDDWAHFPVPLSSCSFTSLSTPLSLLTSRLQATRGSLYLPTTTTIVNEDPESQISHLLLHISITSFFSPFDASSPQLPPFFFEDWLSLSPSSLHISILLPSLTPPLSSNSESKEDEDGDAALLLQSMLSPVLTLFEAGGDLIYGVSSSPLSPSSLLLTKLSPNNQPQGDAGNIMAVDIEIRGGDSLIVELFDFALREVIDRSVL